MSEEFRADVASSNWAESPVAATMNAELGDRIQVAIGELPEDLRVAVVLRDVQGLSNQKAADALDVSVSALKARLPRLSGRYTCSRYESRISWFDLTGAWACKPSWRSCIDCPSCLNTTPSGIPGRSSRSTADWALVGS